MVLIPGTRIGPYEVDAFIGAGGMGEVYRARDRKLGRDVAIKTLPLALVSEPSRLKQLQDEAFILARLNHPNIGAIYGLEESGGTDYLVLEFIDGETLAARLRTGSMATPDVLSIASQIADALEAAHAKGITHQDIKPSNIKITSGGRVKLLDFGIAASIRPSQEQMAASIRQSELPNETLTQSTMIAPLPESGLVVGTPPYMSPEQIRGEFTDQRTDVWAFGCVVFELFSGRQPFLRSTVPDTVAAVLQADPDWSALPGSVPAEVVKLLRNCLTKDARRRVGNFADIRRGLARAISELAVPEGERPRRVVFLGALPVVLIAALALVRPSWLAHFDDTAYDIMLRWSISHPPDPRVVIIDIDDRSLGTIGRWPRDLLGRLVDRLRELGADTIAFNMMLAEPATSREFAAVGVGPVRQTPDELLAESLRRSKVVVGYGFTFQQPVTSAGSCELHPLDLSQLPSRGTVRSDQTPFFKATGVVCTLPSLAVAAGRSGFLNGAADPDGVFRRVPLVIEFNGRVYPSLAVATVAAATSTRSAVLNVGNRNHVSLTLGERVVPLDGNSNLLVRFRGQKRTLAYVSAADIMDGRALPSSIRNKIAFVGYTAFGIRSAVRTSIDADFFDLEVQATVADNLLQGDFFHRAIRYEILECVAVFILGVTLTLIVARGGLMAGAVAAVLELVIAWAGATWLLSVTGTFLSPFYPTASLGLVFVILTLGRIRRESRRIGVAMRKIEDTILHR